MASNSLFQLLCDLVVYLLRVKTTKTGRSWRPRRGQREFVGTQCDPNAAWAILAWAKLRKAAQLGQAELSRATPAHQHELPRTNSTDNMGSKAALKAPTSTSPAVRCNGKTAQSTSIAKRTVPPQEKEHNQKVAKGIGDNPVASKPDVQGGPQEPIR